ncbi:MAG: 2-C-methyl-D-erythritol 2,4-cyclodiphosphate synthase [Clostridiales bacterium]|nr:2-C-methyl-D-erythritol 2,4-cyclodiphosphate synthase [Clostridiales bacterium]
MENEKKSVFRIGHGYDVHRFCEGRKLIIGGVEIPYEKGLLGHSDADVLCHAIADALLGAIGEKDIGFHFPDTDEKYAGISSIILLGYVKDMLLSKGAKISNIDATVIMQSPRLSPFTDKMKDDIANALGTDSKNVNIKATTEEKLGFTGSGGGAAAHAVCLIYI